MPKEYAMFVKRYGFEWHSEKTIKMVGGCMRDTARPNLKVGVNERERVPAVGGYKQITPTGVDQQSSVIPNAG